MATPRKNWFKVPDSVAFDSLTNDELACLIRLQAYMNTRWARDGQEDAERGKCAISPSLAKQITGKHRADIASKSLRHLADIASISVRYDGDIALIEWPKYAKFQETASRELPSPRLLQAKTSPRREERETEAPSAPAADAAPRSPRRVLVEKPENFPEESKARLRAWADRKGFDRSLLNAGLDAFRDWTPLKPPYRRTFEQWEGAFKKIVRDGVVDGKLGKPDSKPKPVYRRDETGQVLVPNEWRGAS